MKYMILMYSSQKEHDLMAGVSDGGSGPDAGGLRADARLHAGVHRGPDRVG